MKLPSDECHWTFLMISQHWFRQWFGAVRQQAITWANVDPDLCHHKASLGLSELTLWGPIGLNFSLLINGNVFIDPQTLWIKCTQFKYIVIFIVWTNWSVLIIVTDALAPNRYHDITISCHDDDLIMMVDTWNHTVWISYGITIT